MIINESPYLGKRFIGDTTKKTLHDFERGNCPVAPDSVETFDFPKQAHDKDFKDCPICIRRIFLETPPGSAPSISFKVTDNTRLVTKARGDATNKALGSPGAERFQNKISKK